ncbi:MAG: hypothetical protein ACFFB3_10065 [Candidatus Hodarchaeota archaeon]
MSSKESWRTVPLAHAVMQCLEMRDGIVLDSDLKGLLEKMQVDWTSKELNGTLLHLEISGLIHVKEIKKGTRKIMKIEPDQSFLAVGED